MNRFLGMFNPLTPNIKEQKLYIFYLVPILSYKSTGEKLMKVSRKFTLGDYNYP